MGIKLTQRIYMYEQHYTKQAYTYYYVIFLLQYQMIDIY